MLKPQVSSDWLGYYLYFRIGKDLGDCLIWLHIQRQTEAQEDDLLKPQSELMTELGLNPQTRTRTTCF